MCRTVVATSSHLAGTVCGIPSTDHHRAPLAHAVVTPWLITGIMRILCVLTVATCVATTLVPVPEDAKVRPKGIACKRILKCLKKKVCNSKTKLKI